MGAINSCEISRLPEDCLSRIISLTSPRDACRCSAVSTSFRSTAAADAVWGHFLPPDIDNILSNSQDRPVVPSKKALYFHLSNHGILVEDGKMNLRLDRSSGAKIYMMSAARAIGIVWGDNPLYWQRLPNHESRFSEVQKLILVWWLQIVANISCINLTPRTKYGVYFIFKLEDDSNGLDLPIEAVVMFGAQESRERICLQSRNGTTRRQNPNNLIRYPQVRDDHWSEVELGEFYTDEEEDDKVIVKVEEIKDLWAKRGLIFNGIELRPKPYTNH